MKPVTFDLKYWVDQAEVIQFIEQNSDMHWNQVCDYVQETRIFNGTSTSYHPDDFKTINEKEPLYSKEIDKWMHEFFKAHPKLNKDTYFVFDD